MNTTPLRLEEFFKKSGVPTHTFVAPTEYQRLMVSLRTAGRGVVIEGPSGIGKTSAVVKALTELGMHSSVCLLSARKREDRSLIEQLPTQSKFGTVVIDDFHRLDEKSKNGIADLMKTLADEEDASCKIIIIGINQAGHSLVKFANDIIGRVERIRFESNPEHLVIELIEKGEKALKISINTKNEIAKESNGSFSLAQTLCYEVCLAQNVLEATQVVKTLTASIEVIRERVLDELSSKFSSPAKTFALGKRPKRGGRAPYLQVLYWLAQSDGWSLNIQEKLNQLPSHRPSVGQIVDKGFLADLLAERKEIGEFLHYDSSTSVLAAEDPKFIYYIRNLVWKSFSRELGFAEFDLPSRYDFALSFAGEDRTIAEALFTALDSPETPVFYDKNEQSRILAENVEDYLGPIYRTEARFVIPLLSKTYPKKIWTKFESEQFKNRFGQNSVIPIWFTDAPVGLFDESKRVGGLTFDPASPMEDQIRQLAEQILKKLQGS